MPPELGFGAVDVVALVVAVASSIWVYASRDTHGYVTVGYRVPFHELPWAAKRKGFLARVAYLTVFALFASRRS